MAEESKKAALTKRVGATGLDYSGGTIQEVPLRELEGRRWFETVNKMSIDPTIGAIQYAITALIQQVQWQLSPADDSAAAAQAAEFVNECITDMDPSLPQAIIQMSDFLWYGWGYMEITYKKRNGEKKDPLQSSRFTDGKIGWGAWEPRGQETVEEWDFADGRPWGWYQNAPPEYDRVYLPLAKGIHLVNRGRKMNPEGKSILVAAYRPWYFKHNLENIEAIGIERNLTGLPIARIPEEAIGTPVETDWVKIVKNIRRDEQAGIVMPSTRDENGNFYYEFALLSTGVGTQQVDISPTISRKEREIAQSVLANFIVTGMQSETGSFALHSSQTSLFSTALGGHLNTIRDGINKQAIEPLCKLNGIAPELTPVIEYGDIEKIGIAVLTEFVKAVAAAGYTMTDDEIAWLKGEAGMPAVVHEGEV